MLLNVIRIVREHCPHARLIVEAGTPDWMVNEFRLTTVSTMKHCWARVGSRAMAAYAVLALVAMRVLLATRLYRTLPKGTMEHELLDAITCSDLVWMVGGGYLNDLGSLEARAVLSTAWLSQLNGCRLIMTGQGLGPFNTWVTRWLLRTVAARAESITLREPLQGGLELAALRDPRIRWQTGVDDACSLPAAKCDPVSTASLAIHFRRSSFHVGSEALAQELFLTIESEIARGGYVKLFVFSERSATELDIYLEWQKRVGKPEAVEIVQFSDPRRVLAQLEGCRCAIGMAYHFHLFALLSGIPSLALYSGEYYDSKYAGIDALFEQDKAYIRYEDVNHAQLRSFISSTEMPDEAHRLSALKSSSARLKQLATKQIFAGACSISQVGRSNRC